jgi:ribonuclease HII
MIIDALVELGVDEAGRGALVGPLVMAGVIVYPETKDYLIRSGVRDSKLFSGRAPMAKKYRAQVAKIIKETCPHYIESVSSYTIDRYVKDHKLNLLESEMLISILCLLVQTRKHKVNTIIIDGEDLFKPFLESFHCGSYGYLHSKQIIAENKADSKYVSVAAASILAKDYRDNVIEEIFGSFPKGGGYPNPETKKLLRGKSESELKDKYQLRTSWNFNINK